MKRSLRIFAAFTLMTTISGVIPAGAAYGDYPIQGVPFSSVKFTDHFWQPRLIQNQQVTIPIALGQCWSTGRVANFQKAAAILQGSNIGWFSTEYTFDDTDIYKILEGMSYSYQMMPSADIKAKMDTLVKIVAAAQEPDGYLTTARTAGQPGKLHYWLGAERWTKDPDLSHELYNSGHLFEAAVAHYQATGEHGLLDVAIRNADLLVEKFLNGGLAYEPGHQIVEMGLVKMYRVTGREDYLRLAKYFLDIRGVNGPGSKHYEYNQSHLPPSEQQEAVGHAVRAAYMYAGMADVAAIMDATEYQQAIDAIWNNVVEKKYYITGGIGAVHDGEKFGQNYDLPNLTAYNETCAAIANVYWNWRMFLTYGESKYYDVIERTLYNGVLSGISLSGDHFFYPNPLESTGGYSRSEWFGCACCPSNLCRFIPSVPGYVYAHQGDSVYVNLFVEGDATIALSGDKSIRLSQTTGYPWDGAVTLTVSDAPQDEVTLKIRIPGWVRSQPVPSGLYSYIDDGGAAGQISVEINGSNVSCQEEKGYMVITRTWHEGDRLTFDFPMTVRRVTAADAVAADRGKVALERGPIVYCLEWPDNGGEVLSSVIADTSSVVVREDSTTFSSLPHSRMLVLDINGGESIYTDDGTLGNLPKKLTAIPYYAWANRGTGEMTVWAGRTAETATPSTRNVSHTDTLKVIVGEEPQSQSTWNGYPSVPVKVDIAAVAQSFGISVSEVKSLFGTQITYAAIEPVGTVNTESTAGAPGHWFAADGSVTSWENTGTVSVVFSEFKSDSFLFNIGQFPARWQQGDTFVIRQALTYFPANAAPRRVVFEFTVEVTDARGVYERELAEAQRLLSSILYNNVKGNVRTALQSLCNAGSVGSYSQATQQLYSAVSAFIDAKVSFDDFDLAVAKATNAAADYPYATDEKLLALTAAAMSSPSTPDEATAQTERVNAALRTVVLSNADAERTVGSKNLISNPDFADNDGTTAADWEITTFIAGFKTIINDASYDTDTNPYFVNYGSWGQGTSSFDFRMTQTVPNVGKGLYLVSLMSRGKDLDEAVLKVATADSETSVALPFFGNSGQLFGYGWNSVYCLLPVTADGDVTLTVTASASQDETFISLGRFRMIRVGETTGIGDVLRLKNNEQSINAYDLLGRKVNLKPQTSYYKSNGIIASSGKKFVSK